MQRLNPKNLKLESNNVAGLSQIHGISTVRVNSRKIFSEESRKSPAIFPNSKHGKPLNARKHNEISQV